MKYILLCIALDIALSSSALSLAWQHYSDIDEQDPKHPPMSVKEENEYTKAQLRGFIFGGIVAFIVYKVKKEAFMTALYAGGTFLATVLWGTFPGIIVGILIIFFNLKGNKDEPKKTAT